MATSGPQDIKRFEIMLQHSVEAQVTEYINNAIRPTIDSLVSQVAAEATKNWAGHIRLELEALSNSTRIQINFVENVVKTMMKENDIKIEVKPNGND